MDYTKFVHGRVEPGEIWSFREGRNVYTVEITSKSSFTKEGMDWLGLSVLVHDVISRDERTTVTRGLVIHLSENSEKDGGGRTWQLREIVAEINFRPGHPLDANAHHLDHPPANWASKGVGLP